MEKKVAECVVNISDASNLLSDYDHMSPGDSHPDTTQHEIQLASLGFQSGKFVGNIVPELGKKLRIPNLSEQIHPRRYQKLNSNSKLEGFFTIDVGSALLLQERMRRIRQKRGRSNTKQSKDQVSFQHQSLDVRQATCCPPPLFILGVSVLQLVVFIYNEVAPDANFVECSLLVIQFYLPRVSMFDTFDRQWVSGRLIDSHLRTLTNQNNYSNRMSDFYKVMGTMKFNKENRNKIWFVFRTPI